MSKLKTLKNDIESAANLGFFNEDAFNSFCDEHARQQRHICADPSNYDIGDSHDPDCDLLEETIKNAPRPDINMKYKTMGTVEPIVRGHDMSDPDSKISFIRGCIYKYQFESVDRDDILKYILKIIK